MIKIKALDHIVLRAEDEQQLITFYNKILGCQIERQLPEIGLTQLRAGSALIDIVGVKGKLGKAGGCAPGLEGHNVDHFCLTIEDIEPTALLAFLDLHNIAHGGFSRRYGAEGYVESIYIKDPQHNSVELKLP